MRLGLAAALFACIVTTAPVWAHHSYSKFFTDRSVSIDGRLESFTFANPHAVLVVRTSDARRYTAVWRSAYELARAGVSSATLKIGDHLVVAGSPARDADVLELSLITDVARPADGWRWTFQRMRP